MSRTRIYALCAAVVALSGVTILVVDSGGDAPIAGSTTTTTPTTTLPSTTTTTAPTTTTTTTTIAPDVERIAAELEFLGVEGQARQVVMFGAAGGDVVAAIGTELVDACIGGIFVAGNNGNWAPAGSLDAATDAIGEIEAATETCSTRPLVATDAETGTNVLKVPVSPLPSPATLEANHLADPGTTSIGLAPAAEAFARELADAGVHVNFGVVADVDVAPGYYMDRQGRSFGGDPAVVSAITEALVEGHCRAGVAPTLKHFPNQGSTVEDPHLLDSFSINDPAGWSGFGALPYATTLAPLVMTGHIRYEGVDGGAPASLSPVITSWLRDDLGYDGVIVTDDMHVMRGVGRELAPAERAVAAIRAGADIALFVEADDAAAIVAALASEAEGDPVFAARLTESAERVLRLKGALGLIPGAARDWFAFCSTG